MTASVAFDTTVTASGNNTGIVVPDEIIERLGAGRRPPVIVNVNGYEYRSTVAVMRGQHMIGISAADTPREVDMPEDFARALQAEPTAKAFFDKLSNSLQRYHADNVTSAKT